MKLIERHTIKKSNPLYNDIDRLCFLSKNVFNSTLYIIKQAFINKEPILKYVELDRLWRKGNADYKALPYTQCSQQTMRCVYSLLKSFFGQIKSNKVSHHINLPRYKDSIKGRYACIFTSQCISVKDGRIRIKINREGNKYLYIKTDKTNIRQVKIYPLSNSYAVDVIYEVADVEKKHDNNRYAAIDLGINNLMTVTSNVAQATIFDGRKLKSINQHYNKRRASLQSKLTGRQRTSARIRRITSRRNNKVKDCLHKMSKSVVDYLISNDISYIIIGKNDKWKDSCNLGHKTNQTFIMLPHSVLIQMIKYKCERAGINVVLVNEAYTSKCSFIDNETVCKHDVYACKRIHRGLFRTKGCHLINADVNGSYNIMRIGLKKLKCNCDALVPADKRFLYNPVRLVV